MIRFEWDERKARSNLKKHGVSFEEARSVFHDEMALQFHDDDATAEDRFILIGMSRMSRVLIVVHSERGNSEEIVRIISARKATGRERKFYPGAES